MGSLKTITITILFSPLLSACIIGAFSRIISKRITNSIVILLLGISCVLSIYILQRLTINSFKPIDITLYVWGSIGAQNLQIGLLIDQFSALMLMVVSIISFVVHIYSICYMDNEYSYQRFFSYISFFTFAMLVLVSANNFLQLFFAWEMVGFASYLLIGFWFTQATAVNAGFKAFLINRISDFGFLIGIGVIFCCYNSLNYSEIFFKVHQFASTQGITIFPGIIWPAINIICILLLIGALGKSAQLPFHVWLPDSMAGPLPVSALIHAATMVTAGIFMIARVYPIFEHSVITLNIMLIIGAVTCVAMGLVAVIQNDIKQILTYSTISQLGLMMVALGSSSYLAGVFHLVTHAFFKALLFLGAGAIIMAVNNQQDLRNMGGLRKQMPFAYIVMLIASLAAVGFPGFSGFYSKDLILTAIKSNTVMITYTEVIYFLMLFNVFITSLYIFRMFFLIFHSRHSERSEPTQEDKAICNNLPITFKFPLIILAIFSLVIGWLQDPYRAGSMMLHGFVSLPFLLVILGGAIAWLCYIQKPELSILIKKTLLPIYIILNNKYWFNEINNFIVIVSKQFGRFCLQASNVIIEGMVVNSIVKCIRIVANILRNMQTGYLYHYILIMIAGLIMLLYLLILGLHGYF